MSRGRPRKRPPNLPAHIDYSNVPPGLYWDPTGAGRWYVRTPRPDAPGFTTTTVAQACARMSDLHSIAERRIGGDVRGSIADVIHLFFSSLTFTNLADSTQRHYQDYARAIIAYRLKNGTCLGDALVDRLTPGFMRRLTDIIAQGQPASGERPAIPGYPTKANHWLRFLRRVFAWAREHDHIQSNPAAGVRQVKERADHRMPTLETFRRVQDFARQAGQKGAREKGALPPYLWAAMEIAYQAILRGIEVRTLTDAHDIGDLLKTNRRKGSRDTLVRKGEQLAQALDALRTYRATVWARHRRPVPIDPARRYLLVGEDGGALSKSGWHSTWQRLMRLSMESGLITQSERFGLHSLKHRGVTDSQGDKKRNSGHKTDAMTHVYNHEIPEVDPAADRKIKRRSG